MNYTDKAIKYANDVVEGNIVACRYVTKACQRFLNDLKKKDWRWKYSAKHANHICGFMEHGIKHVKGPLAGELIKLEPCNALSYATYTDGVMVRSAGSKWRC